MDVVEFVRSASIWALPVIFAITLHEAAHGYAARLFGDPTAQMAGRISINPLRHIDLVGTILVPLAILAASTASGHGGLFFGWAKPVPVNVGLLRRPKRDMLWVAAAGPLANLLMALGWALAIRLAIAVPDATFALPLALMGAAGVMVNVVLAGLNLLPLPPLDGGRIAVSLLPTRLAWRFQQLERWGMLILLGLLFTGLLGVLVWPLVTVGLKLVSGLVALSPEDIFALIQGI